MRGLSRCQDMTQPLSAYFVDTSHNTYLEVVVVSVILQLRLQPASEGNQLSSRSSVLRYVEVLRTGCRSVEAPGRFMISVESELRFFDAC